MKLYNNFGYSIEGVNPKDYEELKKQGWMTEEEWKKNHEGEKENGFKKRTEHRR